MSKSYFNFIHAHLVPLKDSHKGKGFVILLIQACDSWFGFAPP